LEIVLEDQMLHVDKTQEAAPDVNLSKKLLKKEQRLFMRLQEEQEAEARAQDRFQRAQTGLQRRLRRLERISGKLLLVRKQIADLQITDQQSVYTESTLVIPATPESTPKETAATLESEALSPSHTESTIPTSEPEQEASTLSANLSDLLVALGGKEGKDDLGHPALGLETSSSTPLISPPVEATPESEGSSPYLIETTNPTTIEQEPAASADSTAVEAEIDATPEVDTSSDSIMKRVPTKPLRLEQEDQHAAGSFSPDILSAKEAWVAAESVLQNARNAAHGIAASISFLSQSDGLSSELMEELVLKQADANKALLKAQDAARVAYERFIQTQKDVEHAASQPVDASMNTSEDHSQQKQENDALPPAEENGADQTAKLHAIRLYKEW
jgi:hypothetical protein